MAEPDLFSRTEETLGPLAVRMRPRSLDEVVGQQHVLAADAPLGRLLRSPDASARVSMILWGPPGVGKTTLANLMADGRNEVFEQLSAVTSGVKDVRDVIAAARRRRELYDEGTVLFIDEVHRFSKAQQDALLPAVENGWVTLVAATTENPSFAVIAPLLSRSLLVPLRQLSDDDVRAVLTRAVADARGLAGAVGIDDDAIEFLVRLAAGDVRHALTLLEAAAGSCQPGESISVAVVELVASTAAPRYDRAGGQHYDVASAFIKSLRGSDVDAALHYLARMLVAGEDTRFIARRLVIFASEDIGMADSSALTTAVNAMQAVSYVGMPEARITLGHAVVHLALAPKSNRAYQAVNAAIADVEAGLIGEVPPQLRDGSTASARAEGAGAGYEYPHDFDGAIVATEYAPRALAGRRYYFPSGYGAEARWADVAEKIRKGLGRERDTEVQS